MHVHYEVFVRANSKDEVEEVVIEELEPYSDNYEGRKRRERFYDWCQVGGRWRGVHVDGKVIPPEKTTCSLCGGTGLRSDEIVQGWYLTARDGSDEEKQHHAYKLEDFTILPNGKVAIKCNTCDGVGKETGWPTQWPVHEDDVLVVAGNEKKIRKMFDGTSFFGYQMGADTVFNVETGKWLNRDMIEEILKKSEDWFLVTMDCHT